MTNPTLDQMLSSLACRWFRRHTPVEIYHRGLGGWDETGHFYGINDREADLIVCRWCSRDLARKNDEGQQ